MGEQRPKGLFAMSTIRRIAAIAGVFLVTVALFASPSSAQAPQEPAVQVFAKSTIAMNVNTSVKRAAQVATVAAYAQPGEGVIRIMERVCGSAANWQNVAASNNIIPPVYLVLLGQRVEVQCSSGGTSTPAAAAAPAPAPAAQSGWTAPLPGYGNGNCNFWEWRGSYNHRGEDIAAPHGTPIHAVAAGTVSTAWDGGAGNYVTIRHSNGMASVYMHLSSFQVYSGWVNAGAVIGYVGSTGNSSGPHLHLEVQPWGPWNGVVNPISYLRERGVSISC
jgi:hypothetical protein